MDEGSPLFFSFPWEFLKTFREGIVGDDEVFYL